MAVIICARVVILAKTCNGWNAQTVVGTYTTQAIDDATEINDGALVVDNEEKSFPCRWQ